MHPALHQDEERLLLQRAAAAGEEGLPAPDALLLRALQRRVRDGTRVILGLLALQADRAGDPEVRRELGELAARALATAHERLGHVGTAAVDLAAYLRELGDHLAGFQLGLGLDLALTVEAEDGMAAVATEDAVTLGVIVNELVADGAARACPGRPGAIRVELRGAGPGWARLTVADDGRGPPEECGAESGPGFVEGLAAQLGAELAVARSPRRGTQTTLAFPLAGP